MAGLQIDEIPRLKLKWAFGVPGVYAMLAQPTVMGGRLFFGSVVRKVYSIDANLGCIDWAFDAVANVRTAITIGPRHKVDTGFFKVKFLSLSSPRCMPG
jgi:polyvinyl alcohol dehydrogenase (cytochrome)